MFRNIGNLPDSQKLLHECYPDFDLGAHDVLEQSGECPEKATTDRSIKISTTGLG